MLPCRYSIYYVILALFTLKKFSNLFQFVPVVNSRSTTISNIPCLLMKHHAEIILQGWGGGLPAILSSCYSKVTIFSYPQVTGLLLDGILANTTSTSRKNMTITNNILYSNSNGAINYTSLLLFNRLRHFESFDSEIFKIVHTNQLRKVNFPFAKFSKGITTVNISGLL